MRKRLMASTAAIIIVGFLVAFALAAKLVQDQYQLEFTRRLDSILAMMESQVDDIGQDPQGFAVKIGKELQEKGQEIRITILDSGGNVIGDSGIGEQGTLPAENHLYRPEIQQAQKEAIGYDTRKSDSIQKEYYYAAVQVGDRYFLRAALPTEEMNHAVTMVWMYAMIAGAVGSIIVVLVTWLIFTKLSKPLKKLSDASLKIAEGDYTSRVEGIYTDEMGNLAHTFNLMADNTQQAIDEMKSKQHQLEGVLQGMHDGVLAVNADNMILFLNDSAKQMLGVATLQTGKSFEGSLLVSKIAAFMNQALKEEKVIKDTVVSAASPQGERIFTVYATPIQNNKESAVLAVIADVTHVSKLEQLRSEFVANVTHELKTPLTAIRGSIELLKSADRDEETRRYFYDVLDIEAERLHHLIDMLVLSQIENAKPDSTEQRCDVAQEIRETVARLYPIAEKANITLKVELKDGICVACSSSRLQQMLGNLIENAIKYNKPNGSVKITAEESRQMAVIRIQDTGIGIEEEHFNRLFERFYRVDTSRSRAIGGTGLGLSIVKHLAVLYGGEVSVESTPGVGTTFTVRLPLLLPEKS